MLPGWSSLESASVYTKLFTYAGWLALFSLGVFEILAHVYSVRETTLRDEKQLQETTAADKKRDSELRSAHDELAAAKATLAELQERNRPRTLDADARSAILDTLSIGDRSRPITISFISSTDEPGQFASALADLLKQGGWRVDGPHGGPMLGLPARGLIVRVSENSNAEVQALNLQHCLNAGGLGSRFAKIPAASMSPDEIELLVGLKP